MVIDNKNEVIILGDIISFKELDRLYRIARMRGTDAMSDAYFEGTARQRILDLAQLYPDFFDNVLPGEQIMITVADTLERLVKEHNEKKDE